MLLDAIVSESPTVTRQRLNPGLIYSDGVNHGAESQPGAGTGTARLPRSITRHRSGRRQLCTWTLLKLSRVAGARS